MLIKSIAIFLFSKLTSQMQIIKYYDYPSSETSYKIESIGKYYSISSKSFIYFSEKSKNFTMERYPIPPEIGTLYYTEAIPEISALLLVGNSSKINLVSFSKENFLKTLKTYELKVNKHLHFVKIEMIKRIPNSNIFMASGDNSTIAKLDYVLDNIIYLNQYIDYVSSLAISPLNLYLTSSSTGLLCLSDWTKGEAFHLFSTKSYLDAPSASRINITVFVDFLPERQYFVFASSSENYLFFFDGVNRRIFNRLDGDSKVRCITHIQNSSYLAVGSEDNSLYFLSIDYRLNLLKNDLSANLITLEENDKILVLDNQKKFVVWSFEERICHYACDGCSKPLDDKQCKNCTLGYEKDKEGKCVPKCPQDFYYEDSKCKRYCKSGAFERLPRQCGDCDAGCLTCVGASNTECLSCKTNEALRERGSCTPASSCQKLNSILDPSKTRCLKCFENCLSCSDTGSFNCSSCKPGHHYDYFDQTCTQQCFLKEYYNYSVGLCMRCPPKCVKCQEMNLCDLCEIGKKKIKGRCYDACPEKTYELPFNGTCAPCKDVHCKRCPYNGECKECSTGLILDSQTGSCSENCSRAGVFLEEDTICSPCSKGCKICTNRTNCEECFRGFTFKNEICVKETNIYLEFVVYAVIIFVVAIIFFLFVIYCMNMKKIKKEQRRKTKRRTKHREKERKMFLNQLKKGISIKKKTLRMEEDELSSGCENSPQKEKPNLFNILMESANKETKKSDKIEEENIFKADIPLSKFNDKKKEEGEVETERIFLNLTEREEMRENGDNTIKKTIISSTEDIKEKNKDPLHESKVLKSIKIDESPSKKKSEGNNDDNNYNKLFTLGASSFKKIENKANIEKEKEKISKKPNEPCEDLDIPDISESGLVSKINQLRYKNGTFEVKIKSFRRIEEKQRTIIDEEIDQKKKKERR